MARLAPLSLLLLLAACGETAGRAEPPPLPPLRLPAGGPLGATQVRFAQDDRRDAALLADTESCGQCHEETHRTWAGSAHARASFDNPFYRHAVDEFRAAVGEAESAFCAGCHDPVLLTAGALEQPVAPTDPRAAAGVTCRVCHGVQAVTNDGSGSYTLSTAVIPLPDPNDAASVARHRDAVTPAPLRTGELCGACHRGSLSPSMGNPHFLAGVDDLGPWRRSGFAASRATRVDEPVEAATCQGCHMPGGSEPERPDMAALDGRLASHRFAGAQTHLATDDGQRAAHRALLEGAARIDVAAVRRGEEVFLLGEGIEPGAGELTLDVVLRNERTGHHFPGGLRDVQDTWVEVVVADAQGRTVASAGTTHEQSDDPTAHVLRSWVVDAEGRRQDTHLVERFAATLFDSTLGPREAKVVRYAFLAPADAAWPLRVTARLRHRRHPLALREAACDAMRSERGRALATTAAGLGRGRIEPCAPGPVVLVAAASMSLGPDGAPPTGDATADRWRRLFDLGLGLAGQTQEHLDEARAPLHAALESAPAPRRGQVLMQLARVAGRQGRLPEALRWAEAAEDVTGRHPAVDATRGDAYAQVWRWPDAARVYARAVEEAPSDDSLWARLARARGSAGDDRGALDAARSGLALSPRDESLLRSQYLSARALGHPDASRAEEAWLAHRIPDARNALRMQCAREDPLCARSRLPVPRIELRRAADRAPPNAHRLSGLPGRDVASRPR